jgi:DNA-binding response OmpR family regulator
MKTLEHPRRVLVVDDSSTCRAFVRDKMERAGWVVTDASDGESGAAAALRAPPDVVVADHTLPGLSGTPLCRLLRTDLHTELVPIVIIAGSDSRRKEF